MKFKLEDLPLNVRRQVEEKLKAEGRGAPPKHADPEGPKYRSNMERRYCMELEARRLAGEIKEWHYEPRTFVLGSDPKVSYTPDVLVVFADSSRLWVELKGPHEHREKGILKVKWAMNIHRDAGDWTLLTRNLEKNGGGWKVLLTTVPRGQPSY